MSATPRGDLPRNEGRRAFPYGPRTAGMDARGTFHARKSVLALGSNTYDKYGAARLRESTLDYSGLTRDGLRAVAKSRGLSGYGHLNKAGLVELLS